MAGGGKAGNAVAPAARTGKHGGARNQRGRSTMALTERQCRDQIAAAQLSMAMGLPYNRWITIAWEKGGIDARDAVQATGQFVKLAREWVQSQEGQMPWQWTQERGRKLGAHVHMLLHVPPELDPLFGTLPKRWVKRLLPGRYVAGVLHVRKLPTGQNEASNPAVADAIIMGKVHYMLKAAPVTLESKLAMERYRRVHWGQPCMVFDKRAGIWQGWREAARLLK